MGGGRRWRESARRCNRLLRSGAWRGGDGDQLLDTIPQLRHDVLEVGDALLHIGLPRIELLFGRGHLLHRGLELGDALVVLAQHGEDALELLVGLHRGLEASAVVVGCQDR